MSNPALLLLPNGAKWKKFAEAYSLDLDHILVFKYVGRSEFQVVILDQSGLEMSYPLTEATLDGEDNDEDVETKRIMYANRRFSKSKAIQNEELLQNTESSTALERANYFHSENPFFIREMHTSYIKYHILAMPGNFITEDQQKENDHVFLWISEERTWNVKFYPNRCSGQIILGAGWMEFLKDNNLKIGDLCVFEQIKKPGISFRVVIFRDREQSTASQSIPIEFARNHGMENITKVILRVGNRSWPVKLNYYSKHNYCRLTSGWSEFMSQCKLKSGDVCHFELIDKGKFVFEVRVTGCID
ncbi:hypothetical protein AAZX31_10G266700 [Glycine max]